MKHLIKFFVAVATALCLAVLNLPALAADKAPIELQGGMMLKKPQTITDFKLTFTNGESFTPESFKNHWSVLFFGFTNCPYLCPTTMATLKQTAAQWDDKKSPMPEVIFISVDPDRDTLEKIATYVHSFNPQFKGAGGDSAALEKLTKPLHVLYMKTQSSTDNEKDYSVDHSGTLFLINPKGELVAIFNALPNAKVLVKDLEMVVKM